MKTAPQSAQIFYNNKLLLLTHPKIAHSWCRNVFLKSDDTNSSYQIDTNDFIILDSSINDTNLVEIWNNFIEKKEIRDFVILYRNPINHWISALIQDTIAIQPNNAGFFFEMYLHSMNLSTEEINLFLHELEKNDFRITKIIYESHSKIVSELIYSIVKHFINNRSLSESSGHFSMWSSFLVSLIISNKIDKNKIKLFNIENSELNNILQPYTQDEKAWLFKTESPSNKWTFNIVYNFLKENEEYNNKLLSSLNIEMMSFNSLENLANE